MTSTDSTNSTSIVLAFEGGATHTKAAVVLNGEAHALFQAGPCNPTAYGNAASARALIEAGERALAAHVGEKPRVAAIGSAGAVDDAQRRALGEAVCRHFQLDRVIVATDLHPLLLANAWDRPGVLAIAGTGSNVLARAADGRLVQVGGRGQLLGDDGSGYMIAAEALRHAARAQDGWGPATALTEALPRALALPHFDALIAWGAAASKRDVAGLARVILRCAGEGDKVALACVQTEASLLADQVLAAARGIGGDLAEMEIVFGVGGLFETYPLFVDAFNARLSESTRLRYAPPKIEGPAAVAVLTRLNPVPAWAAEVRRGVTEALPGTETAPDGPPIDALSAPEIVRRMLSAEAGVATCLERQQASITALAQAAADTLNAGGRIVYFGAGTSGRLGVLDASECGPTFGVGNECINAHIAGGDIALRHAAEGAEDDAAAGAREVAEENIGPADLVIGIAASGSTPYVRGALEAATARGARTGLVCCAASSALPAQFLVALDTGPEVLPGSTRLKAGTATKVVLNIISTAAMTLSGRVFEGRMVAMRPTNKKLRTRATRMLAELTGLDASAAKALLEETGFDIRTAVLMSRRKLALEPALASLEKHRGNLAEALQDPTP